MKQRFSYLDLQIITNEVSNELVNCYLQNIYSLESSNRHFMFKFDAGASKTGKQFLIVDPGMRYHLTKYQHEATKMPTFFVQKLRKYLKNKRATKFTTAPASRLLVITFNEGQFYLVFEFFAGGNLILLNAEHKILTLFRTVRDVGPNHTNYELGAEYALEFMQGEGSSLLGNLQPSPSPDDVRQWIMQDKLGKALQSKISDPSSSLLEYYLRVNGLDPKAKVQNDEQLPQIMLAIDQSLQRVKELLQKTPLPGYILFLENQSCEFEPFDEYFKLVHPNAKLETYNSYNETVDQYFGAILTDKAVNKVDQLHALAEQRLNAAKNEKLNRIKSLQTYQEHNQHIGDLITLNATTIDLAIQAVQSLSDMGTDWGDAANLIKMEQEKGNEVAKIIENLKLETNQFTIKIEDESILITLGKSALANAKDYFELKRSANSKIEKTSKHAAKALKSAEQKIKHDLAKNLEKHKQQNNATKLHEIRTPYWFEKFYWFLTSNQVLVIGGRDESQRNMLLRKYFVEGDLLMGSDAPEASLLVLKKFHQEEIPPQSILQACAFCTATSVKTWEAKSRAPAWYLTRSQVPKVNNMGELIKQNDLHFIKGKTMVPPSQMEMGMAVLWQTRGGVDIDESEEEVEENDEKEEVDDEEDFPDTQFDSDEDFPDTQLDSEEVEEEEVEEEEVDDVSEVEAEVEAEEDVEVEVSEVEAEAEAPIEDQASDDENVRLSTPTVIKKARGSKKKLKKYQNQDEEDRKAAMERLGTLKGLERKAAEQTEKENKKKLEQELRLKRQERARKADLADDGVTEKMYFPTNLQYQFKEGDGISSAVMMFAPWASIQKAQYKVKLVFGSLKKGKASQELLRVILNTGAKPATEREKVLVQAVRPIDIQQSIAVSKVQLSSQAVKKPQRGQKKKK